MIWPIAATAPDGFDAWLPTVLPTGAVLTIAYGVYTLVKAWRLRQAGRGLDYSALLEEAAKTITRKDGEIDDLKAEIVAIQAAGREERVRLEGELSAQRDSITHLQAQTRVLYDTGEGYRRRLGKYEDEEGNPR